ncbi:adenine deaminase [Bacillus mesophilus]|uniref:adenine deaminase n=1 Tax=Bacillus mesophilus TaxID=1808955 RepID=A0A6M0Q9Y1_9BACI|nr:adenine deaminase C-terminal domain-containing protein [Bacillus mesophilus]MBM7662764.1 adenine deaminase [Bacillus mesophilus]NEY73176.1 adenine deaminase [Bacillus mesophilus]
MNDHRYRWRNLQLRRHLDVLDGKYPPTMVLKDATFLHSGLKQWLKANIWIYEDRIVYIGDLMPKIELKTEIVDCQELYLVPGYIEPHSHPFQVYNPHSIAQYSSQFGTTTLINDNLILFSELQKKKAFTIMDNFQKLPQTIFWWCRFDSQSELANEEELFSSVNIKAWLERDDVLQGGELTGWPRLLDGDDMMLHWIQEAKYHNKLIEGHFPGASERTLMKLKLLGADADHESISGKDIYNRLMHGYSVALRYSSIRPDLPYLLEEMKALQLQSFDSLMFTTDGSTPSFYEQGFIDLMIKMAIDSGIPLIDAYHMGSYNVAKYYSLDHYMGHIATGKVANINFLSSKDQPKPVHVMAKGQWLRRDEQPIYNNSPYSWEGSGFSKLKIDWELTNDDLQFSMALGMKMENAVIMKPYSMQLDTSVEELSEEHDESFLLLVDQKGKWRINTVIKGFANKIHGLASSYSSTGDFILIGKKKDDMLLAFKRMKELGGGIVLVENGKVIFELALPLAGRMSNLPLEELIPLEKEFKALMKERGYLYLDPVYSLLFLSSTHLPYIRVTPMGIYDVMKKMVLFPTIMR